MFYHDYSLFRLAGEKILFEGPALIRTAYATPGCTIVQASALLIFQDYFPGNLLLMNNLAWTDCLAFCWI